MSEKQTKIVHLVYGILLSLLILLVGICFIASCVDIYLSGDAPFTKEAISSHFILILAPVLVCIFAIIGGGVLHAIYPAKKEEIRAKVSNKTIIKNLSKKVDWQIAPVKLVKFIKSQRRFRLAFLIIAGINTAINVISALVYVYTSDLSKLEKPAEAPLTIVLPVVFSVLAYLAIPFFLFIIYKIFSSYTYEKELEALKLIIAENAKNGTPVSEFIDLGSKQCFFKKHKKKFILALQISILTVVFAFLLIGFITGDINDILTYANNICTGCIGLG